MQDSKHTVTWEVKPWEKDDLEAASGWAPLGGVGFLGNM